MWYYIEGIKRNKEAKFAGEFEFITRFRADGRRYTTVQFDSLRFSSVRCYFFRHPKPAYQVAKHLRKRIDRNSLQNMRVMTVTDDFIEQYMPKNIWPLLTGISVHLVKDAKFKK